MKTVEEINKEIMQLSILRQGDKIPSVLKDWATEIINECAAEVREEPWQITKEAVLAVKDIL